MKDALNATKSLLNDKNIEVWHTHTSSVNRAGSVLSRVKYEVHPELLTQAWLKFYECLSAYSDLVQIDDSCKFSSLHLCEAPGAFVAALNHFLVQNYKNIQVTCFPF